MKKRTAWPKQPPQRRGDKYPERAGPCEMWRRARRLNQIRPVCLIVVRHYQYVAAGDCLNI